MPSALVFVTIGWPKNRLARIRGYTVPAVALVPIETPVRL